MKFELSVIVPVYNEEEAIESTIRRLFNSLSQFSFEYEIIIINDGSVDKTEKILNNFNYERVHITKHKINKGYGSAIKTGIKLSKYEWILIVDADGTYPIESVGDLIKETASHDLVIGSREKIDNAIQFERRYAKKILNIFASYIAGKKIPDLNSGFRIFKKNIVKKYWELFPSRFSFTSTLTMICMTHGYDTIFVPIDYYKRIGKSSIRPSHFVTFIRLIIKLSLFFKPIRVFIPISMFILFLAIVILLLFIFGVTAKFLDSTFIILCATSLQTFFFGLLAEIIIHNKS
jgi:glycosyltransferase involved in cell wall biosynthesis